MKSHSPHSERGHTCTRGGGETLRTLYSWLPKIFQHEGGKRKSIFSDNDYSKNMNMQGKIFILRVTAVLSSLSFAEWLEFPGQRGNLGRGTRPMSRKWQHPGIMGVELRTPWKGFLSTGSVSQKDQVAECILRVWSESRDYSYTGFLEDLFWECINTIQWHPSWTTS